METTRRHFLQLSGAALALALVPTAVSSRAFAAPLGPLAAGTTTDLRTRWVDSLTSRAVIAANPAAFTDAIATMDRGVVNLLKKIAPTSTRYFTDTDWTVGATELLKSNQMRLNYVNLEKLATAWATPGSAHRGSVTVLDAVRAGLAHMHDTIYNTSTSWWGNWWSWNIGAAQPLANIMAIIHDELDQATIDSYCADFDHFLPNRDPSLQQHPSGVQSSDGANRVDICQAVIVRALVQPDEALLKAAVEALSPTWQYVTGGNGFFEDGSFVQHSTIGYTGTYGLVLLGGLSKLFALLADSPFDITDPTRSNFTGVIEGSFAPLMFNGQMMDAVRGRAIARHELRSKDNGNEFIEYTLRLAKAAPEPVAERWRGLCRQWIETNEFADIATSTNIARRALVIELLASGVAARPDQTGPKLFPAMDRLVYRSSDASWAVCVAMCSNRISWHEGTGAENMRGVKTSQGMTYLYRADDDRHFDDHFWATSNLEAPVGTTVDLTPLPNNPEGEWGGSTPANEWTGGTTMDQIAVAGMHLVAPGGTGLTARKAWFFQDDMMIALGSDISSPSGAEVQTVVEHRNLGENARQLIVDGAAVAGTTVASRPRWAHLEGTGGYLFLGASPRVTASVAPRTGRWSDIATKATAETTAEQTRQYATLAVEHGVGGAASATYAYAVLPGADRATTESRSRTHGIEVIRNDRAGQAVRLPSGTICALAWQQTQFDKITLGAGGALIVRKVPTGVDISLSDPTQQQDEITLTIKAIAGDRVFGPDADRVQISRSASVTTLRVDVRDMAGMPVQFSVRKH